MHIASSHKSLDQTHDYVRRRTIMLFVAQDITSGKTTGLRLLSRPTSVIGRPAGPTGNHCIFLWVPNCRRCKDEKLAQHQRRKPMHPASRSRQK